MQSYNTPNQVPDAAPLFDGSLVDLLTEVINPEDMEGLDEFLSDAAGDLLNSPDVTGVPQVQMASTSPTQNSSQVPSAQPLLTTQMGSMGQMVQLSSMKQMDAMGQMVQLSSTKQMVAMGQMVQTASTMQSGQTGHYDPSAQPILPLLMMQSTDASVLAASQVQTGGQASGATRQDILSENRQLHDENQKLLLEKQKLLTENSLLKLGNQYLIKRIQELKLKVDELKLKLKGQVCLLAGRFYIYMVVMKCFIYIWFWRILYILDYLCL